jgi:hypothetical protein
VTKLVQVLAKIARTAKPDAETALPKPTLELVNPKVARRA